MVDIQYIFSFLYGYFIAGQTKIIVFENVHNPSNLNGNQIKKVYLFNYLFTLF